jgi:hypothetical protein
MGVVVETSKGRIEGVQRVGFVVREPTVFDGR